MAQQKAVEPVVDEVDDLIDELQPGAKLLKGQYTITRYLNSGGFGITYLAKDSLDRDVVIKECFPSSVCRRSKVMVAARSRAHTAELRSIVQLFVREARNLAKIVHPNIVAVHQVFEDNGTAYMAIDFVDGLDLQQIIDGEGPRLAPDHIVRITDKLLAAVGFIHDHDMLHRDISPDNVLIDKTGEPILIDFGAAREHASQTTRAMSALRVVKDGYSPQEFYIAGSEQGPWSDLYALAATLYHLISGEPPINGQARLAALAEDRSDPYVPLTGRYTGYPPGYLEAIDRAMSTLPKQRLQSAKEWMAMVQSPVTALKPEATVHRLAGSSAQSDAGVDKATLAKAPSRPAVSDGASVPRSKGSMQIFIGVAAALAVASAGYVLTRSDDPAPTATAPVAEVAAAKTPEVAATTSVQAEDPKPEAAQTASALPATDPVKPVEPPKVEAPVAAAVTTAPADAAPAVVAEAKPEADTSETAAATAAETPTAEATAKPAEPAETVAAAPEVAEPQETAAAVPAEESAPAAPAGKPSANQISFAAWDVEIPFSSDDRMVDGKRVAVVTRIPPGVDVANAGDWLAPGVTIFAINGTPIQSAGSLTVAVMNAMAVDPDGKARVVVEYSDASRQRKTGLLTVGAVRLVNLANGVGVRTTFVDDTWKTVVTGVSKPDLTTLRQGDVLFRDKSTTTPLDGPDALETIIGALISEGKTQTSFSIIRDKKVSEATMQLILDSGP